MSTTMSDSTVPTIDEAQERHDRLAREVAELVVLARDLTPPFMRVPRRDVTIEWQDRPLRLRVLFYGNGQFRVSTMDAAREAGFDEDTGAITIHQVDYLLEATMKLRPDGAPRVVRWEDIRDDDDRTSSGPLLHMRRTGQFDLRGGTPAAESKAVSDVLPELARSAIYALGAGEWVAAMREGDLHREVSRLDSTCHAVARALDPVLERL